MAEVYCRHVCERMGGGQCKTIRKHEGTVQRVWAVHEPGTDALLKLVGGYCSKGGVCGSGTAPGRTVAPAHVGCWMCLGSSPYGLLLFVGWPNQMQPQRPQPTLAAEGAGLSAQRLLVLTLWTTRRQTESHSMCGQWKRQRRGWCRRRGERATCSYCLGCPRSACA